ncbi:hypothetical protein PENSUB_7249 [Penicillium subrubescens]|uniref:Uncharacterized protein n=1 Tax=Penicillium subrubescens TaxID=1316194 RepID=A0A1Q5TN97_9EURO|nr:hypothetical protein PENSUB_7249 [Penicillium subrubescens]
MEFSALHEGCLMDVGGLFFFSMLDGGLTAILTRIYRGQRKTGKKALRDCIVLLKYGTVNRIGGVEASWTERLSEFSETGGGGNPKVREQQVK